MAEAAVRALAAGCDGLLLCGTDLDAHARVLEAVIRAAESDVLPAAALEDSMARHRRMKERFLAGRDVRPAGNAAALRAAIGRDEHQAVAAELARFL